MALDIAGPVIVQIHRSLGYGIGHGEIGWQFFVFDFDQIAGRLSDLDAVGGNGGDRFALLAHTVECYRQFGARDGQHAMALVGLGTGDDRMEAGQCLGGRNIDRQDAGMGDISALDATGQRGVVIKIGRVKRAA